MTNFKYRAAAAWSILWQTGEPTTYPFTVRAAGAAIFLLRRRAPRLKRALLRYQSWRNHR